MPRRRRCWRRTARCAPRALYWGGYITRYWHYLTGETSKQIYAQCDETRLLQCYGFHSEANEMAIAEIKAIAGKSRR